MAKSNQSKSAPPATKAAHPAAEAAPAKKETKPAVAAAKPAAVVAKPATAPKGKKAAKPATGGAAPVIDTSLAASTAAKLLANRNLLPNRTGGEKPNSAGFRQMKEGLSKPMSPASVPFLQGGSSQKKSSRPFNGPKQVGHNQTFGADVNRAGVPRRTGGG
jgi:hypothetical protein